MITFRYDTVVDMGVRKSHFLIKYIVAQVVTALAGIISYPLDTIRRRLMMQSGRDHVIYKGTVDCFRQIYRKEGGYRPFYKGALSNVFRGVGAALVLVMYEEMQNYLDNQ